VPLGEVRHLPRGAAIFRAWAFGVARVRSAGVVARQGPRSPRAGGRGGAENRGKNRPRMKRVSSGSGEALEACMEKGAARAARASFSRAYHPEFAHPGSGANEWAERDRILPNWLHRMRRLLLDCVRGENLARKEPVMNAELETPRATPSRWYHHRAGDGAASMACSREMRKARSRFSWNSRNLDSALAAMAAGWLAGKRSAARPRIVAFPTRPVWLALGGVPRAALGRHLVVAGSRRFRHGW